MTKNKLQASISKKAEEGSAQVSHYKMYTAAHKKYEGSEKGKAARSKYMNSEKGKVARKRYQQKRNELVKDALRMVRESGVELS